MFLIEYSKGNFINGDNIVSLHISAKTGVCFYDSVDTECEYQVEDGYEDTFLNNLQAINNNISNIQSRYEQLRKEKE